MRRTRRLDPRAASAAVDRLRLQGLVLHQQGLGLDPLRGPGIDVEPGLDLGALLGVPPVVVTRPSDLLRLRFSFDNLRLDTVDGVLSLVRARQNAQARLIVDHPPQHLAEQAGLEEQGGITWPSRPVQVRLSTHSRLVFSVGSTSVPWTLEGLLQACLELPLVVAPNAAEPQLSVHETLPWVGVESGTLLRPSALAGLEAGALATTLSTWRRSVRAARVLDDRVGVADAVAAFAGMRAGGLVGEGLLEPVRLPRRRPTPKAPEDHHTSIELPWRMKLSPGVSGGWRHSTTPVDHGGRVELWHTRLGLRGGTDAAPEVRESGAWVRAIWARDFEQFPGALPGTGATYPAVEGWQDSPSFTGALSSARRMKLVHETANFDLLNRSEGRYVPPQVQVDHLMLTGLGGWLRSRLDVRHLPKPPLDIEEWQHVATGGRDHFVKIVETGILKPFGHRASLVTITERKLRAGEPGTPAYLLKRQFIVVREPTRSFTSQHDYLDDRGFADAPTPVTRRLDLVMPFASVTLLDATTPLLDARTAAGGGGLLPGFTDTFFPTVEGRPFGFRILAVDRLGHVVDYPGPLLFVSDGDHAARLPQVVKAYYDTTDPDRVQHRLAGQQVSYAPDTWQGQPLDTTLATSTMRWDLATDEVLGAATHGSRSAPMLRRAQVVVPSLSALAGRQEPITVRYPDHYASQGLVGNAAQVFLAVEGKPALSFSGQGQRSGGLVSPNLAITGLSGASGPIGGDLTKAVSGPTNAADFFGGLADSAKLFGVVPLAKLVASLLPGEFPRFVAEQVDRVGALQQDLARLVALGEQLPARVAAMAGGADAQAQAVADAAADVGDRAAAALQALAAYTPGGPFADRAGELAAALGDLAGKIDAATTLPPAVRADAGLVVRRLTEQVEDVAELVALLDAVANGLALPETVTARLHWSTELKAWPSPSAAVFLPRGPTARLDLAVEVQAPTKPGKEPSALATCSLSPFSLRLLGSVPFIALHVERIAFTAQTGRKTDVDVVFAGKDPVEFLGPLRFVKALEGLIPFDGFSDPPYLDVSDAGIRAGFDLALPDLPLGILNLTQMSLGAEVNVPFVGESLDFRFSFCTRERPFHLTVWLFGGGGFFAITVTPEECRILEAAFEFGACVSLDFGVASGSIEVMAGIYFRLKQGDSLLCGYFRLRGEVDVLGLISASLELYLEIGYEPDSKTAYGRAELTIEVEVLFFSTSVTIEVEKRFQGSDQDPPFTAVMGPAPGDPVDASPWADYCAAFAAV